MSYWSVRSAFALALAAVAMSLGCAGADDDSAAGSLAAEQQSELSLTGKHCSIRGQPPTTQGCAATETCVAYACTNSVPPSCIGTCQPQPQLPKQRCDVSGDPPLTTGCTSTQTCVLEACTDSIPPHCFGYCAP